MDKQQRKHMIQQAFDTVAGVMTIRHWRLYGNRETPG
jgi:hypothetical protein